VAFAAMTGTQGVDLTIDDESIKFLAHETSEQVLHEIVRRWIAIEMGYPTPLRLAALAETIHLDRGRALAEQVPVDRFIPTFEPHTLTYDWPNAPLRSCSRSEAR
jgi:hypothetical protein